MHITMDINSYVEFATIPNIAQNKIANKKVHRIAIRDILVK